MTASPVAQPAIATRKVTIAPKNRSRDRKRNGTKIDLGPITANIDPIAQAVEEMFAGLRCNQCGGARTFKGRCHHERIEDFDRSVKEAIDWYNANPARENAFVVIGAIKREILKSGLRDITDGNGVSVMTKTMANVRATLGLEPKWVPHRQTIADELPL